jgi:membrane protein
MFTKLQIVIRAAQQWSANGDSRLGAALAYYALFSIAPLLVIAISIAGIVYGDVAARGEVKKSLSSYIDPDSAGALEKLVESAAARPATVLSQMLSIAMLVFGALGAFVHLRASLCLIWRLEPPKTNTILATLIDYLLALAMVLCTGVLLLGSVAASLTVSYVRTYMDRRFTVAWFPWDWVEFGVSAIFLTLLFAAIYRVLSGQRVTWGYVWYGALVASLLFTVGKLVLSYYFVYAGVASAYGAAGSLVVFLVWVYYSSQTLFFGAELIQARRTRQEWLPAGPAATAKRDS